MVCVPIDKNSLRSDSPYSRILKWMGYAHLGGQAVLFLLLTLAVLSFAVIGCGSGGYAGGGVMSLSTSAVTIDAGQTIQVTAQASAGSTLSWAVSGTSCSGASCGTVTSPAAGTAAYTAPSGITSQQQYILTANIPNTTSSQSVTVTVNPDPVITGTPGPTTVGSEYTATLSTTGGTAPMKWSMVSGKLPNGLAFNTGTGVISGTTSAPGASTFVVQAVDSSAVPFTVTAQETIVVTNPGDPLTILSGNPPNGVVGVGYSSALYAGGGTGPYTFSVLSGSLPAGLSLAASTGAITGTPTTQGNSTFTAQVADSAGAKVSATFMITVTSGSTPLSITVSSLPNGTVGVAYSSTIGVSGGVPPYSCTIVSGALQAGLSLNGCTVSGIPTAAGTATLSVKVTDASSPTGSVTGTVTLTIVPAPLILNISSLPDGKVGTPYTAVISASGGTTPYSCAITSGTLPAGLSLNGCTVSGTPTTAGTSNLIVKVTDSGSPAGTSSGPVSITIVPANLTLTVTALPNGIVGTPYTATIGAAGGNAPYACTITSGTLPAGLVISGCTVSGTPTVAVVASLTVKVTDSSNPANTTTGPVSLTILPAAMLTIVAPPTATVNVPYTGTIGATGGSAPYTCTLVTGTLPAGLSLSGCTVSGTPTSPGSSTLTVKVVDNSSPSISSTGPVVLTVAPATSTLTLISPPDATITVPYTGTIGVSGGTGPYTCLLQAGTLPAGLTISNCTITGTPTVPGTATLTIKATDSASPANTTTGPVTLKVVPVPALTFTGALPNAILNQPYSQTLSAQGGVPPYTYTLTSGSLPAGLQLSSTGVVSGTPTATGASSFTVTVKDTESTPQTASLPLVLLVTYPTGPNDGDLNGPYAYLFQGYDDVLAGVLAYQTATAGSFTADGAGLISAGELDENHQGSNPLGSMVNTNAFIGTYTIGTDHRGLMTLSTFNADGTVGKTTTFAIAMKAPASPATNSAQGDMIESDGDQLQGARGSGTLLAQTTSAYAAGLHGSYTFGVSGDSPCLPSCTIGIIAGPAAAVGQFTTDGAGNLTGGQSDANLATTAYAKEALTGNYTAADGNGRLHLSMSTANTPNGVYPTDYAVYLVDANHAFLMSTDKHSAYVLLAGSAELQTQSSFNNSSMTGAFVGYENSISNPGLVGGVLQNVLNLSTATIFRGTANNSGTCDITNVDTGGVTSLVGNLTGILGSALGLTDLLGAYTHKGSADCTTASNGRGVLQYPVATLLGLPIGTPPAPRVYYLSSPDHGYFLETGYAGLGKLEQQTGNPFTVSTLKGTFVYGTTPASSLASINAAGTFTADGAGHANWTQDMNVGVGTINVIDLGTTGSGNYVLTDGTAGRYLLGGTTVIYAISPSRYVLLDTNVLTTSPSVQLLY